VKQGRREHRASFKAKVALEAVKGEKMVANWPPSMRSILANQREERPIGKVERAISLFQERNPNSCCLVNK